MGIQDHGSRWACFVEHDEILYNQWLPTVMAEARPLDPRPEGAPLEQNEVVALATEGPLATAVLVAALADEKGELQHVGLSAYPFLRQGIRQRLVVQSATAWEDGVEGWVQVTTPGGETTLTLFDSRFHVNQHKYQPGMEAEFVLGGLAYAAQVDQRQPMVLDNPEVAAALRAAMGKPDEDAPFELDMSGTALLLQRQDMEPDDYEFMAPVKAIEPVEMGPFKATRITVTALRPVTGDIDIELYVPDSVWRDQTRPKVGDDLSGVLWLQGYMVE